MDFQPAQWKFYRSSNYLGSQGRPESLALGPALFIRPSHTACRTSRNQLPQRAFCTLVGMSGLEPLIFALSERCTNRLCYIPEASPVSSLYCNALLGLRLQFTLYFALTRTHFIYRLSFQQYMSCADATLVRSVAKG